ncbi:MAG: ANTAR domain-containing protein [Mycobacteriales bacterium]
MATTSDQSSGTAYTRRAAHHDQAADERDQAADERDQAADERDRRADVRDLLSEERVRAAEDGLAGMRLAMDTRAVIEQAKGMIMITLKVDADAAFEVLVRRSQTTHKKLSDVAIEIVQTGMSARP